MGVPQRPICEVGQEMISRVGWTGNTLFNLNRYGILLFQGIYFYLKDMKKIKLQEEDIFCFKRHSHTHAHAHTY